MAKAKLSLTDCIRQGTFKGIQEKPAGWAEVYEVDGVEYFFYLDEYGEVPALEEVKYIID